ncbi:hypothetical protein E2542_SST26200 [Spatholobus suberectus]|nr:hypothetical protein E2542_SST26200 [Spatholobus suberectus]
MADQDEQVASASTPPAAVKGVAGAEAEQSQSQAQGVTGFVGDEEVRVASAFEVFE